MSKKVFFVGLVLAIILSVFAGCTQPASNPDNPEITEKVLKIATPYSIATLNPTKTSSDGDGYVIRQILEGLVSGETGDLKPLLATSWKNVDDLTWEFELRENAYWQEGNPVYEEGANIQVKAEDVKACFDYVVDPANKAKYQARIANVIDKVEVVNDFTVRFITREPAAWFLTDVARVPIFSLKALEVLGEDKFDFHPIGTGPFKFVEYAPDDKIVLVKNDKYHVEPKLDKVIFRIIPDQSVAAVALQTGEIDISLQVPTTEVAVVRENEDIDVVPVTRGWYRYAAFNCDSQFFKDQDVREAVACAVDMSSAVQGIFDDPSLAERTYCSVVPGIPGYSDCSDLWEYDVEKAKKLLSDAGWVPGKDGILEKDGVKFSFTLKTAPDAQRSKLGIIMATDLKKIGIDCKPQSLEWATLIDDSSTGNYDMFIAGGYGGVDGLFMMFHSTEGGGPELNYVNSKVDTLLNQAKKTVNREEREKLLIEAARQIASDRAHYPAYLQYVQVGIRTNVVGFDPPSAYLPLTSPYRNVDIK